jgi:hypothetical protein
MTNPAHSSACYGGFRQHVDTMKKIKFPMFKTFLIVILFISMNFADCDVPGDFNNDDALNVIDLVLVVRCSFLINPSFCEGEVYCYENMDINDDGNFDILDVVGMVAIILGIQ